MCLELVWQVLKASTASSSLVLYNWVLLCFSYASVSWIKNHNEVFSDQMEYKLLSANVQVVVQGKIDLHMHVSVPHSSENP